MKAYKVDVLLETDKIYAQIPELENRDRLDATQTMEINVDPADIHTENISQDVKKKLGHDTENFVHTEDTKAKEVDTLTMVVELVRLVIKVSKSYHNDPRRVKKVRVATSTSKFGVLPFNLGYSIPVAQAAAFLPLTVRLNSVFLLSFYAYVLFDVSHFGLF